MSIKGLTDSPVKIESDVRGKPIRLGHLQKGYREGFGRSIKLHDTDYLIFKPLDDGEKGKAIKAVFDTVYGPKPQAIDDVRLPVEIAGNFDIESCAWLVARKHTERGSTFLAMSDGVNIKRMRRPSDGRKVDYYHDGVKSHGDHSHDDGSKYGAFVWNGNKLYQWQQEMQIDLVLPDFNRELHRANLAGYGVVTLITHATWDIANLIAEYHGILDSLAGLVADPLNPGDFERKRLYMPLRNFPLRLYRSQDKITTPDYRKNADPGERLHSTRSLLHWQLSPDLSLSVQTALDGRTQQTLQAIANVPLLTAPQTIEQANADLFTEAVIEIPATAESQAASTGPDWEADLPDDAPEVTETAENTTETTQNGCDEYDWLEQAERANNLDLWAFAAYQFYGRDVVSNANSTKNFYQKVIGTFDSNLNRVATKCFMVYVNTKADTGSWKTAKTAAKQRFAELTAEEEE